MEPITRKEVFLNAMCADKPCALEPVSREEILLKRLVEAEANEGGGSGLPSGSKPNQYIVTDGDGNAKWEDRLGYIAVGDTVLPETTPTFNEDADAFEATVDVPLVVGEYYKVTYNGEDYICKASRNAYEASDPSIYLGNVAGLPNAEGVEPFFVVRMDGMIAVIPDDGAESVTIAIAKCVVKKIDERLIPEPKHDCYDLSRIINVHRLDGLNVSDIDSKNSWPSRLKDSAVLVDADTFREYANDMLQRDIRTAVCGGFCVSNFGVYSEYDGGPDPAIDATLFRPWYHYKDGAAYMDLELYQLLIFIEGGKVVANAGRCYTGLLPKTDTV